MSIIYICLFIFVSVLGWSSAFPSLLLCPFLFLSALILAGLQHLISPPGINKVLYILYVIVSYIFKYRFLDFGVNLWVYTQLHMIQGYISDLLSSSEPVSSMSFLDQTLQTVSSQGFVLKVTLTLRVPTVWISRGDQAGWCTSQQIWFSFIYPFNFFIPNMFYCNILSLPRANHSAILINF